MNPIKTHLLNRLRPTVQPMTADELIAQLQPLAPHLKWTEHDIIPPRLKDRRERVKSRGFPNAPIVSVIDQHHRHVVCASKRDTGCVDYCVQNQNGEYHGIVLADAWHAAMYRPDVRRPFEWFKGEVQRQFPDDPFKFEVTDQGVYCASSEGRHNVCYFPFPIQRDGGYEPWFYSVHRQRGINDPPSGSGDFLDVAVSRYHNWTVRQTPELASSGITGVWEQAPKKETL